VHDLIAVAAEDDLFDLGQLVTGCDDERRRIVARVLVGGQGQSHTQRAVDVRALAEELENVSVLGLRDRDLLDPLVQVAEQALVLRQAPFPLVRSATR